MIAEVFQSLHDAFREALVVCIEVAIRAALLFWGVFMGKLLAVGFFESPSFKKIVSISMPIAILVATLFAMYSYKLVVNPGETKDDAIQDALVTFFLVLMPLWTGCAWGAFELGKKPTGRDGAGDSHFGG